MSKESENMKSTVILLTREGMGQGDPELTTLLIGKYLQLLSENDLLPNAICCYANGVKLAVTGSPVLDQLRSLEAKGVRIILCGTCLNFFNLTDQVQVGIVGGMGDILSAQALADKVITL